MSTAPNPPAKLTLYDHPVSSYAQKVRIALREKGLPFKSDLPPGFGDPNQAAGSTFPQANPRLEIPVLIDHDDGDVKVFDSTIILEYLEDKWPEPALLPPRTEAGARAKARMVEEVCDTAYEAVNWGYGELWWFRRAEGHEEGLEEHMKEQARRQTRVLQQWLGERLGDDPYFNGQTFGWGDLSVAPIVNRSVHYGFDFEKGGALERWFERIKSRPSVAETFKEFEENAPKMSAAAPLYLSGQRKREYRDHRLEWMVRNGGLEIVRRGISSGNIRFSWPEATK